MWPEEGDSGVFMPVDSCCISSFFFLCGVFPQPCLCKDVLIEEGPGLKDLCPERLGRRKA